MNGTTLTPDTIEADVTFIKLEKILFAPLISPFAPDVENPLAVMVKIVFPPTLAIMLPFAVGMTILLLPFTIEEDEAFAVYCTVPSAKVNPFDDGPVILIAPENKFPLVAIPPVAIIAPVVFDVVVAFDVNCVG